MLGKIIKIGAMCLLIILNISLTGCITFRQPEKIKPPPIDFTKAQNQSPNIIEDKEARYRLLWCTGEGMLFGSSFVNVIGYSYSIDGYNWSIPKTMSLGKAHGGWRGESYLFYDGEKYVVASESKDRYVTGYVTVDYSYDFRKWESATMKQPLQEGIRTGVPSPSLIKDKDGKYFLFFSGPHYPIISSSLDLKVWSEPETIYTPRKDLGSISAYYDMNKTIWWLIADRYSQESWIAKSSDGVNWNFTKMFENFTAQVMAQSTNGSYYIIGYNVTRDYNLPKVFLVISKDGINWSDPIYLEKIKLVRVGILERHMSLLYDSRNTFWLTYTGFDTGYPHIYVTSSKDGINWTDPINIIKQHSEEK